MCQQIAHPAHCWTNCNEREEAGEQQSQHWGDQEVCSALESLVQELLDRCQNPRDHQHRKHGALVTSLSNIQTKQGPHWHFARGHGGGHVVAVNQGWEHHRHTNAGAQELIATETLGCGETNQHWQERERRRCHEVDHLSNTADLREHLHQ